MGRGFDHEGVWAASRTSIGISFYYRGKQHKERIKAKPTPSNILKVKEFRLDVVESIRTGTFEYHVTFPNSKRADLYRPTPPLTTGKYLSQWLDEQEQYLKSSTWNGYFKIITYQLTPSFGHIPLIELSRKHVKTWAKTKDVTAKTLGNLISPLRAALDDAVDDEILEVNPIADMRIKRKRGKVKKKDDIDPFDHDEQTAILNAIDGQNKNMVHFWFWTGLRPSELIALDWADIDFVHGKIRVNKAITQAACEAEPPKTEAGDRLVDLLPPALEALEAQKQFTFLLGKEIFQNPRTMERWEGDQPIRKTMWVYALKRAGVRYRYPYQCRHSFATMMLDAGENIRWISAQLGHKDWTFTARIYTRFMPQSFKNAGAMASEKFNKIKAGGKKV